MSESRMSSKGRTTIPKDIRNSLRLKSGQRISFTLMPDGTVVLRAKNNTILRLAGILRRKGQKAVPIDMLSL